MREDGTSKKETGANGVGPQPTLTFAKKSDMKRKVGKNDRRNGMEKDGLASYIHGYLLG